MLAGEQLKRVRGTAGHDPRTGQRTRKPPTPPATTANTRDHMDTEGGAVDRG
jgi:hypothetical protein